jgi:hypothetical protein
MVPIRACNSNLARQCNALSNSSSSPEFRRSVFEIQFGHGLLVDAIADAVRGEVAAKLIARVKRSGFFG